MAYVQEQHRLAILTPLGKDVLLLRGFNGFEAISQMFEFDMDLLSENESIRFEDIVGKNVTLRIDDSRGVERHWNGFISRFSQGTQDGRLTRYRAQMMPWLWFLTRTADCRIFQNRKVPDIIRQIFTELKFHDYEFRLYATYQPRDYCVQYRETDFNFVSRLMEEEGICYFFDQQDGKHILVMADDAAAHKPCPNQTAARCGFQSRGQSYTEELVTEWYYQQEFRPGSWSQTDYNFETPATSLAVNLKGGNPYEIYDFPGEHQVRADGDRLARIRLQEQTAPANTSQGASTCRAFGSGYQFTLQDHYRKDLNQAWLLTSVRHMATEGGAYEAGTGSGDELNYRNSFECMPLSLPYRPRRVTPRPFVQGCQTAVVVGPGGEEIYTDKHGRVKVQFHWDREGKRNENSSCWVRVSHPWAGQGWGAVSIPRIGQEVIVDFLEGDPDQPIIVGRVYNAEQMPPFGMPGGAMISGIKSNSTKGGGGYNEISLNDTKGTELINIHAQFDQQKKVEHDERVTIGNDRTEGVGHDEKITIGNNRTEKVGVNENITIGSNRTESVGANEKISIGSNRTESVGANETISIGSNRNETVGSNETVTVSLTRTHTIGVNDMLNVGAAQEITVGGLQALTVGAVRTHTVGAAETITVGGGQTVTIGGSQNNTIGSDQGTTIAGKRGVTIGGSSSHSVGGDHSESISGKRGITVSGEDSLDVGGKLTIAAKDQILLQAGDASITLHNNGNIDIIGKDITITASGKFTGKADSDVVLKGQKILQN
jgi:type VI secretion system secreted protein VgrG